MMIRSWVCIGAFCLGLPGSAIAQTATVRTGDHAGFTRLVTQIPAGADWTATKDGRSAVLKIDGFDGRFNTRRAFERITKDRVADITARDGALEITLNCECNVSAFTVPGNYVVLDIASPGTTLPTPFLQEATAEVEVTEPTVEPALTPLPLPTVVEPVFDLTSRNPLGPEALTDTARLPATEAEQAALIEMQQRLARELGTAATRGVLTPKPGATLPIANTPQIDPSALDAELPETSDLAEAPPLTGVVNNMRITSSMDVQSNQGASTPEVSLSGAVCVEDNQIDIENWADDTPFHAQVGPLRERLFGEFDRLNETAALQLAQLYIHFGFGAEALQILNIDPDFSADNQILISIAQIMEGDRAADPRLLRSMLDCGGDIALWAVLAEETLNVPQTIDPDPALLALNKLPVHLRQFIAPALSQRLLSHGDAEAADAALRSLERLPEKLSSAAKLAKANVQLDEGETDEGTKQLVDVIDDNAVQSPKALIRLVDTRLKENKPIDTETAGLIEAYAKELQNTDLGPDLRRAHVLALVKSGQFDRAFDAAQDLGGDAEDEAAVSLRLQLIRETTAAAEDVVFLDHIFKQTDQDIARLRVADQIKLAERLLTLGFAAAAQDVMAITPDRPRNTERQILEAQIAIALNRPLLAQAALVEITSPQADILRAEAKKMDGAHEEAAALFQSADLPERAADAAWLAEGLQRDALSDNPLFGPVVGVSEADLTVPDQTTGMLARTSDALEESQNARQVLAALLQAPELRLTTDEPAE